MLDAHFKIERVLNFKHAGEVRQGKATIGDIRLMQHWRVSVTGKRGVTHRPRGRPGLAFGGGGGGSFEPRSLMLTRRIGPLLALVIVYFTLFMIWWAASSSSITGYYFGGRNAPARRPTKQ